VTPLSSLKTKIIPHDYAIRLFSNISQILEVNLKVVNALEKVEEQGEIGHIFRDMVQLDSSKSDRHRLRN
jgi:hypothetical protein